MDRETLLKVTAVKALSDFTVELRWDNDRHLRVNLREPIFRLRGLKPLRDARAFAKVFVGEGGHSIEWPGELDMGAGSLWETALEQNGHADAAAFIRWRWRNGLSLSCAAAALGISRRQVAYYASGEHQVPRHILLATKGWESEQQQAQQIA
jgi:hypothetical protein